MVRSQQRERSGVRQHQRPVRSVTCCGIAWKALASKHAQQRAEERGIEITGDLMARLNDSVGRAQAKGAKNILVFDATRAFIVNVPQSRVITAISQEEMKDNVFTNIDGAVLL